MHVFGSKLLNKKWSQLPTGDLDSKSTFVFVTSNKKILDPDSIHILASEFPNSKIVESLHRSGAL
jgi:hypothetical protein